MRAAKKILGGMAIIAISGALIIGKPAPAEGSASVLVPSLTQTVAQLQQVITQIQQYKAMMENNILTLIPELLGWGVRLINAEQPTEEEQTAKEEKARQLAAPETVDTNLGRQRAMVSSFVDDKGLIVPDKAAAIIIPPVSEGSSDPEQLDLYARVITGEQLVHPRSPSEMMADPSGSTEYELARTQYNQRQLLAQQAVKQYSENGAWSNELKSMQEEIQGKIQSGLSVSDLQALQLAVQVNLTLPVLMKQLDSSLRQERLLGVMLATEME